MKIRRLALGAISALALTAALAACGSSGSSSGQGASNAAAPADASEPVKGGTLIYGDQAFINSWLLAGSGWYQNATIIHNLVDRLVYYDAESKKVVPWLASSWEINEDATEFTFVIRDGVTFSDGTALTADIVKKNFDQLAKGDEARGLTPNPILANYYESSSAEGSTFTLKLKAGNVYLVQALTQTEFGIVAESTLAKNADELADPENLIGSGSFVFESQKVNQEVTLVRRQGYAWPPETSTNKGEAYLDKVVIKTIPEPGLRAGAVQSGQVQIAKGIQPTDEQVLRDAGFTIYPLKSLVNVPDQISLRPENPLLSDVRVRKALTISIDRKALVEASLSDSYPATTTLFIEGVPNRVTFDQELAQDLPEANRLLDEAGWEKGADGIRAKDGKKLRLEIAASSQSAAVKPAIDYLAQKWREDIGVELVNRALDDTFFAKSSTTPDVPLKLFRPTNTTGLGQAFSLAAVSTLYEDPELTKLYAEERATLDDAKRAEIVKEELSQLLVEKVYTIPLYEPSQVLGGTPKLHITFNAYTSPNWQSAWIEKD